MINKLINVCYCCKKVKTKSKGYITPFNPIDEKKYPMKISHGLCPECLIKEAKRLGIYDYKDN